MFDHDTNAINACNSRTVQTRHPSAKRGQQGQPSPHLECQFVNSVPNLSEVDPRSIPLQADPGSAKPSPAISIPTAQTPPPLTFPDVMFKLDRGGTITEYFPSAQLDLQWLPPNCVGLSLASVLSEDLATWVSHYSQQALETGILQSGEYVLQQTNQWQHYEARFSPETQGNTVLVIVREITTRKAYEASLRVSELQHQQRARELEQTLKQLRDTQAQLIQAEKLSSLGQLVAGVAHEINNPVNFIHGNLDYVGDAVADLLALLSLYHTHYPEPVAAILEARDDLEIPFLQEDLPAAIGSMRIGTWRICEIVKSLRTFSRKDEAAKKPVDIHASLDSTLVILSHRLKRFGTQAEIRITKDYGTLPKVECYGSQLNQVFMNLIVNALDAMEDLPAPGRGHNGGQHELHLQTRVYTVGDATHGLCCGAQPIPTVAITISDTGAGIPDEIVPQLFDPFFTTKPVGKGTGLGLSICHNIIVKQHGGMLRSVSRPEGGTQFTILLPLYDAWKVSCDAGMGNALKLCRDASSRDASSRDVVMP